MIALLRQFLERTVINCKLFSFWFLKGGGTFSVLSRGPFLLRWGAQNAALSLIQSIIAKGSAAQNQAIFRVISRRSSSKSIEIIKRNPRENQIKLTKKSGKTQQQVISHRPLLMFTTVVMNTGIDRSPCSQRSM